MKRAFGTALSAICVASAPITAAGSPDATNAVRDALWVRERAIYAARSRGDLSVYRANIARGYLAWPTHRAVPAGDDGLRQTAERLAGADREVLTMELVGFSLNGDAAVLYYTTHRTVRGDGTPADDRFEVTHSWVRQDGAWKLLGGMARATPPR